MWPPRHLRLVLKSLTLHLHTALSGLMGTTQWLNLSYTVHCERTWTLSNLLESAVCGATLYSKCVWDRMKERLYCIFGNVDAVRLSPSFTGNTLFFLTCKWHIHILSLLAQLASPLCRASLTVSSNLDWHLHYPGDTWRSLAFTF